MYKKNLLFLGLVLSLFFVTKPEQSEYHPTPQNSVIVVELHDVFMKYTRVNFWYSLCKLIVHADNKKELITLYFDDNFWETIDTNIKEHKIGEIIIHKLCRVYPQLARYEKDLQKLSVTERWKPQAAMVNVLQKLKKLGYIICGVANLGPNALDLFCATYPEDFDVFDAIIIPEDADGTTLDNPGFYYHLEQNLAQWDKQILLFCKQKGYV